MKGDRKTIELAVNLAQMNLPQFRAGDWLNLQEDLLSLLVWPAHRCNELSEREIAEVQAEVSELLRKIVATFSSSSEGPPARAWRHDSVSAASIGEGRDAQQLITFQPKDIEKIWFTVSRPTAGESSWRPAIRIQAGLRDAVLFTLCEALTRCDVTYIRQCPGCARLFYAAHGRQRHCSQRCASRTATARFRARHREAENERAMENYEKQVRNKLGKKVKVRRRTKATQ